MYQEAILKLVRPVERGRPDRTVEEEEDYDEYMKKHLERVRQHSFRFGRARWTSSTNSNSRDIRTEDNQTRDEQDAPDHSGGLLRGVEDETTPSLVEETDRNREASMEVDPGEGTSRQLESAQTNVSEYGTLNSEVLPSTSSGTSSVPMHHSVEHNYASSSKETQQLATDQKPIAQEGSSFLSPVQKKTVKGNFTYNKEHQLPTHEDSLSTASRDQGESSHTLSDEQNRIQTRSSPPKQRSLSTASAEARQESAEGVGNVSVSQSEPPVQREEHQVNIIDVDESSQDGQNMMSSLIYSLGLTEEETKRCISMWHNRTIIPQLDVAHFSSEVARRRQLYEEENENYEHQNTMRALSQLARVSIANVYVQCILYGDKFLLIFHCIYSHFA